MITLLLLHPLKRTPVQVWPFENESVIRIGRSTDNHVILYSAVVSRHHVELRQVGGGWEIENLGTNGTYLDGKRITKVPVTDGAIIRLARSGPNIQIRIGTEALNDLPENLRGDRTTGSRFDLPPTETEITDPLNNRLDRCSAEAADVTHNQCDAHPGTIPVPPHLRLPNEVLAKKLAIIGVGSTKRRLPSPAAIPSIPPNLDARIDRGLKPSRAHRLGLRSGSSLQTIGDYQILQVLGQGDIGVTYLARREQKQVVLKTLTFEWVQHPNAQAALEYEADILRQINHPKIPQLVDFFSIGDRPYLAMEMVPGESLTRYAAAAHPPSIKQAIAWMIELCSILNYLHSFAPPILHRNIEPGNIICQTKLPQVDEVSADASTWLEPSDDLFLVGFGTAKAVILGQQTQVGATGYSSSAQLDINAKPDADLYSLGPLCAYILTGHHPVSFCEDGVQGQQFCADRILNIPSTIRSIIRTLTHPDPELRYQTAAAAATAFKQLESSY